ncbi:hypothetical protein OVA29_06305 [Exiguobacterium sp. SL14]|nr:hypothetical protein [Exiguobacterium sp. SL14]MCY1690398.1 hypothetical protein [Exiguobacterium sp. SL14]
MLAQLRDVTPDIYETTFDFPRARTLDELKQDGANVTTVEAFFEQLEVNRTYVVTGSLYFISEVRHYYASIFTK